MYKLLSQFTMISKFTHQVSMNTHGDHTWVDTPLHLLVMVKKMVLLMSSYSPGVYDGATAEFRDICNYWKVENMGAVTAKIDEQKTVETKEKIQELAGRL